MIEQVVNSGESIQLITKRLYPETAKHFGVKPHSVEYALRTLIGTCWAHGDRDALNRDCGQGAHPRPKQRRIHRYDSGIHKEWREARKSYGAGLLTAVCLPLINNVIYKNPHMVLCGFCYVMSSNTSHGGELFLSQYQRSAERLLLALAHYINCTEINCMYDGEG